MTTQQNQDVVSFQGVDILTFTKNDNHLIAIKPLCESFGIDWSWQRKKLNEDELFSSTVAVTPTVGADGKTREMTCLPLDVFPMWLARINTSRVEDPFAARMILAFQKEATQVLYEHFLGTPAQHKKELERKDRTITTHRRQAVEVMRDKVFADRPEYYECQWIWRLRTLYDSYREVAEAIGWTAGKVSTRWKKYDHYLDATRHERRKLPRYRAEDADCVDIFHWMSVEFDQDWVAFRKALVANDRRFHEAGRYGEQYRQLWQREDKIHGGGRDA